MLNQRDFPWLEGGWFGIKYAGKGCVRAQHTSVDVHHTADAFPAFFQNEEELLCNLVSCNESVVSGYYVFIPSK